LRVLGRDGIGKWQGKLSQESVTSQPDGLQIAAVDDQ
jgi:hypothetical protein